MSQEPVFEIPLGSIVDGHHEATVGAREILIIDSEAGIRVWDGVCPHLAGPLLEGRITRRKVVCPWHLYVFDAATGRCQTVPGARIWRSGDLESNGPAEPLEPMAIALRPLRHDVKNGVLEVYEG